MIIETKSLVVSAGAVALALCTACDEPSGNSAQPRSRVEAVAAAPAAVGNAAPASAAPNTVGSSARPDDLATKRRRALLCEGQLDKPASALGAVMAPDRKAAVGDATLPKDPLARGAKRWTWINFWAAWCVPCREELPLLLGWQRLLKKEVNFAFISLDDDERQLSTFLSEQSETGLRQSYWLKEGPARSAWLEALGLDAEPELPLQLLVDPSGAVRCRVQGAVDAEDLDAFRRIAGG